MLVDRLGLSERRACRLAGQNRSTQRHRPKAAPDDRALRRRLRRLSEDRPRWGYRRAHARLLEEGRSVNRKRVQRLWREALAGEVARSITAEDTVAALERIVALRGSLREAAVGTATVAGATNP